MISHMVLGSNDLDRSRLFYDAVLGTIGMRRIHDDQTRSVWAGDWRQLVVTVPIDGRPASVGNGSTLVLSAPDGAAVDAFHRAGIAHGGSDEGRPGSRKKSTSYVAYVRDPDGHKLCVFDASVEPWSEAVAAVSRQLRVDVEPAA